MKTDLTSDIKSDIVIAWLPSLVLFIMIPFSVYLDNQIEYDYNFSIMFPFIGLFLASMIVTTALLFFAPIWRVKISQTLFYFGVFLLLTDIITPVHWGILDGESRIVESQKQMVIQCLMAAGLILIAKKFPAKAVKVFGSVFVLILIIIQPINIYKRISAETVKENKNPIVNSETMQISPRPDKLGNIYHIVFDGYSSLIFLDALQKLNLNQNFNGFTFYKNNLSNYIATEGSVPSYLTGTFYKKGSFKQWQLLSKRDGFIGKLNDAGFKIWIYSPNKSKFWTHDRASHIKTSRGLTRKYFRGTETLTLAQITFVRLAPSLLRLEVYEMTDIFFTNLISGVDILLFRKRLSFPGISNTNRFTYYQRMSVPLFRELIIDENKRNNYGEYIYGHFFIPHPPFVWDRFGNYSSKSDYIEQTLCATKLMVKFIMELKKLKRFKNALIIFQSDHGIHGVDSKYWSHLKISNEITSKIDSVSKYYYSSNKVLQRIHSLLLIKPPFSDDRPLVISEASTQLIDIPSTGYDFIGMSNNKTEGKSVFKIKEKEQREIHMYVGINVRNEKGRIMILGNNLLKTKLVHFSYTKGIGWRLYPDLLAHSE